MMKLKLWDGRRFIRFNGNNVKNPRIEKVLASGKNKDGREWNLYSAEILPGVYLKGFGTVPLAVDDECRVHIGTNKAGKLSIEIHGV